MDKRSFFMGANSPLGAGGGGTTDYATLSNKPRINGATLSGDKSAADLGLVPETREINGKPLDADITLDASDIGLANVDDTSDADKPVSTAQQAALDRKVNLSAVGVANGVAELDANGKVLSAQLPSYVDDVLEYASLSAFPATGESGKIYVATDTNLSYRWSGSGYAEISPSLALGETSSTAYRGDRGKIAYEHSQATGNAHSMTKTDIGLGNVDNTSDANKPISAATQAALNNKVDKIAGKGLSTEDYTSAEKGKLSGIASGATADAPATAAPLMDGAAAVGTSAKYAREDHRHPTDTSRASAADLSALLDYLKGLDLPKTAAGNPATFADGKAANVKSLIVTITPTQSGSGVPSLDNVRPITGVSSVTVTRTGKNIFPVETAKDGGGANIPVADGVVTYQSPGDNSIIDFGQLTEIPFPSGAKAQVSYALFNGSMASLWVVNSSWTTIAQVNRPDELSDFTVPDDRKVRLRAYVAAGEISIGAMVCAASETDASFEPYRGKQTVSVTLTDGANPLTVYGGTLDATTGTLTVTHWLITENDFIRAGTSAAGLPYYNSALSAPYRCDLSKSSMILCNMMENIPNPDAAWYSTRACINATSASNLRIYETTATELADFRTKYAGLQVVYPLAAPVTYQLTPAQLAALAGYNSVFADAGTLSVTYLSDPSIALGGAT